MKVAMSLDGVGNGVVGGSEGSDEPMCGLG